MKKQFLVSLVVCLGGGGGRGDVWLSKTPLITCYLYDVPSDGISLGAM